MLSTGGGKGEGGSKKKGIGAPPPPAYQVCANIPSKRLLQNRRSWRSSDPGTKTTSWPPVSKQSKVVWIGGEFRRGSPLPSGTEVSTGKLFGRQKARESAVRGGENGGSEEQRGWTPGSSHSCHKLDRSRQ